MAVDELRIVDVEKMIQDAEYGILPRTCCIYKVPRSIREQNEYIYTPTTISIGPFHYGSERLKDMERYKAVMLKRFIQRDSTSLENLICFVRHLERRVRASYSEDPNLTAKEFQKIMLADGAFIIELFVSCCYGTEPDALLLRQGRMLNDITKDLLLLENQLPFFFLEELYAKAFPAGDVVPSFIDLSYMFFSFFNIQRLEPYPDVRINHFTDLLRLFHLPSKPPHRIVFEGSNKILLYSSKQLAEVDIKFKVSKKVSPLDLKFSNGILEVPRILVDKNTLIFFHNMITFEQCHYPYGHYLCDYAVLLDCLIKSHEDVNVLVRHGIIHNKLGDPSDVVRIFDGLSTNLTLQNFNSDYSWISRCLNDFSRDPWNQVKSALRRQLLLSITGFALNMLTLVQTIFSILQVVWR